ncbi:Uncharacterized protein PBTT_03155 [Plasmodiophora brassicae]
MASNVPKYLYPVLVTACPVSIFTGYLVREINDGRREDDVNMLILRRQARAVALALIRNPDAPIPDPFFPTFPE